MSLADTEIFNEISKHISDEFLRNYEVTLVFKGRLISNGVHFQFILSKLSKKGNKIEIPIILEEKKLNPFNGKPGRKNKVVAQFLKEKETQETTETIQINDSIEEIVEGIGGAEGDEMFLSRFEELAKG